MTVPLSLVRLCAGLCAALLLVTACDEDEVGPRCGSPYAGGVIEGQIATGDVQSPAEVSAIDCNSGSTFTTLADDAGRYHLDLPAGAYTLQAEFHWSGYSFAEDYRVFFVHRGPPYDINGGGDTLVVSADTVITADYLMGGLQVQIAMPGYADGSDLSLVGCRIGEGCGPGAAFCFDFGIVLEGETEGGQMLFTAGGIPPGDYLMNLQLPESSGSQSSDWVYQNLWLPDARRPADADTISVPAGGATHYAATIPANPAHLTGSITGSWQEIGRHKPRIFLVTPDSLATVAYFDTRGDGTFDADIQVPEPVRMRISIGGVDRWYPRGSFAEAEILDLGPGASLPPIIVVESGILIEVRSERLPAVWSAKLQLVTPADSRVVAEFAAEDYGNRPFHGFSNLDPGSYWLRILQARSENQVWRPQWYDRVTDPQQATLIHVPGAGGYEQITITLEEGGRIEGAIWCVDTPKTSGVLIYLTSSGDPTTLRRLPLAEDG